MKFPSIQLNSGHQIPVIGLGVYQSAPGKETRNAVATALKEGYRYGWLVVMARPFGVGRDSATRLDESCASLTRRDATVHLTWEYY